MTDGSSRALAIFVLLLGGIFGVLIPVILGRHHSTAAATALAVIVVGVVIIVSEVLSTVIAARITQKNGHGAVAGVVLGIFLSWIGVLIAALIGPATDSLQEIESEFAETPGSSAPVRSSSEASRSASTSDDYKTCPDCAEGVRVGAQVCRYCGYRFDKTVPQK